ncbi:MAG: hypothetical protein KC561_03510 [Myxococcales bacterium]|nr:hypothetical protein [Myxococcales bacterium]
MLRAIGRVVHPSASDTTAIWAGTIWFTALLALTVVSWSSKVTGNPGSRLATVESQVDYGHWEIHDSIYMYVTVDKVLTEDGFLSSKPPLFPSILSTTYQGIQAVTGWTFAANERLVVFTLRVLLHVLPYLLALILAGRLLAALGITGTQWTVAYCFISLGTLAFGYAATIAPHTLSALLVLAALGPLLIPPSAREPRWFVWLGMGFCAALAVTFDFGAAVMALAIGLLSLHRGGLKAAGLVMAGGLLPILAHLHLTVHVTNSWYPFYAMPEIYSYQDSYWDNPQNFDALDEPIALYAFHALFGHHGLFSMTPLFLFAIPGALTLWKKSTTRMTSVALSVAAVLTIATYIVRGPHNYGGTCSGMRWFIVAVPALWYLSVEGMRARWERKATRALVGLFLVWGMVNAVTTVVNPWSESLWNLLLRLVGLGSVPPYNWLL